MNNNNKEMLQTLKRLIESQLLSEDTNNKINNTLKKVQAIYDENVVKVAVLGEFSSGKSTFINGILREDILSYGDEPTTAINTFIKYNSKPYIEVEMESGQRKNISKKDIPKYIKEGNMKTRGRKLEINSPNGFLKDGLVIIDTPGANINKPEHNLQRKRAIMESSVGVFLISSQSLTSKSFIDFLKDNKEQLQKILFVITKCDIFEADEITIDMEDKSPKEKLNSAIEYTSKVIKEYGEISKPKVFAISAKAFIEKRTLTLLPVEKNFLELEKNIRDTAIEDKERIIQDEVEKRLKEISKELSYILSEKTKSCEEEIKAVNGNIQEFDTVIGSVRLKFSNSLSQRIVSHRTNIRNTVKKHKDEYYQYIHADINRIDSLSTFKDKANKIVSSHLQTYHEACKSTINRVISTYGNDEFKAVEEELNNYFQYIETTYKHLGIQRRLLLKKLGLSLLISLPIYFIANFIPQLSTYSVIIAIGVFLLSMLLQRKKIKFYLSHEGYLSGSSFQGVNSSFSNIRGIDETHMAGGGLLIGAFLGGPLGAIIGAGIGAFFGDFLFKNKLIEAKEKLMEVVYEELTNMGNNIADKSNTQLLAKKEVLENGLNQYIEDSISLYNSLLNGIDEYNKNRFVRLSDSEKKCKKFQKEINAYIND